MKWQGPYEFKLSRYRSKSDDSISFAVDHLEHHLVDSVDHVLGVALESRLHASIVEDLSDDQAGFVGVRFSVFVQADNQLITLVVFKGDVFELRTGFSSLYRRIFTFACSSISDFMKAICLMALEIGLITKAGPRRDLLETTTLST